LITNTYCVFWSTNLISHSTNFFYLIKYDVLLTQQEANQNYCLLYT